MENPKDMGNEKTVGELRVRPAWVFYLVLAAPPILIAGIQFFRTHSWISAIGAAIGVGVFFVCPLWLGVLVLKTDIWRVWQRRGKK